MGKQEFVASQTFLIVGKSIQEELSFLRPMSTAWSHKTHHRMGQWTANIFVPEHLGEYFKLTKCAKWSHNPHIYRHNPTVWASHCMVVSQQRSLFTWPWASLNRTLFAMVSFRQIHLHSTNREEADREDVWKEAEGRPAKTLTTVQPTTVAGRFGWSLALWRARKQSTASPIPGRPSCSGYVFIEYQGKRTCWILSPVLFLLQTHFQMQCWAASWSICQLNMHVLLYVHVWSQCPGRIREKHVTMHNDSWRGQERYNHLNYRTSWFQQLSQWQLPNLQGNHDSKARFCS